MTPIMGSMGMMGQRMIRTRLQIPPTMMMKVPAISRIRREKKPTTRETSLSMNMWNLASREADVAAVSAEIWRKGLKSVRSKELMEKKSVIVVRAVRALAIKACQP